MSATLEEAGAKDSSGESRGGSAPLIKPSHRKYGSDGDLQTPIGTVSSILCKGSL